MMRAKRLSLRLAAAPAILALAVVACSRPAPLQPGDGPSPVQIASIGSARMDPAEILHAQIAGDELRLDVRYGGGCAQHHFSLLHEGVFLESQPVQARLHLAHDAQGDRCRALIGRSLMFDLTPLKRAYQSSYQASRGAIIVHVIAPGSAQAHQPSLRYEF
jgi:hypothetical protein